MKKIILTALLFFSFLSFSYAETLQMTTYYPAPFGAYDRLRLIPRADLVDPCDIGLMYVAPSGDLKYCRDDGGGGGTWGWLTGIWRQEGNDIFLTNYASPLIKVGIGLNNPNEQLEIAGNFRLPQTTATAGIIKMGANPLIHAYGTNNAFFGVNAGNFTMAAAQENLGVGLVTLKGLTDGDFNVGLGNSALQFTTTGSQNIAIGFSAMLSNLSGNGNIAVGHTAGGSNTTGNNNIFIGLNAGTVGTPANLINAIAIGYDAQVSTSNSFILGGTGANAVNVGIGVGLPTQTLDINGTIRIRGGTPGAGKVLTSDASGNATWEFPTYAP